VQQSCRQQAASRRFRKAPRLVSVSEGALTEKGSDGKYVSRVHDLRAIASFVVFELAAESRLFAVEWADASAPSVYETNRRQRDLVTLVDAAQAAKGAPIPVLPDFTWVRFSWASKLRRGAVVASSMSGSPRKALAFRHVGSTGMLVACAAACARGTPAAPLASIHMHLQITRLE
jgi:hypothetical protein